jgi:hypothetical protein
MSEDSYAVTTVAAIKNAAKSMATMPVILEKAFKPGKKRKVTDALNTTAALQRQWKVGFAKHKWGGCIGLTTRQVCASITGITETTFFIDYPG